MLEVIKVFYDCDLCYSLLFSKVFLFGINFKVIGDLEVFVYLLGVGEVRLMSLCVYRFRFDNVNGVDIGEVKLF